MKKIPRLIILEKDKLRGKELEKIREHCKDNKCLLLHENEYSICVHLLDDTEIPFHSYVFDLLIETTKR